MSSVGNFRASVVRHELDQQNIKVVDFARDCLVARETMFGYLNGSRVPSVEVAGRMATRLGWAVGELVGRD